MAAEDVIASELRDELEARLRSWRNERTALLLAPLRIAELDALIATAEQDATTIKIAPRPNKGVSAEDTKSKTKVMVTTK